MARALGLSRSTVFRLLHTLEFLDFVTRPNEREVRLGAEDYADEILNTLEINLTKFIAAVQRGRERLQGRDESAVA